MFLLDTNVISELRKVEFGKADPNVARWATCVDADELFLSVMTVMELETGVLQLERKDQQAGRVLRGWLNVVLHEFKNRILPFNLEDATCCARLHIPDRRAKINAFICATAKIHAMTVVTRNTKDFTHAGVSLLNPWNDSHAHDTLRISEQ